MALTEDLLVYDLNEIAFADVYKRFLGGCNIFLLIELHKIITQTPGRSVIIQYSD